MNRIFTLLLLILGLQGWSQQYDNEWIRFNQTYYKFKVGQTGLYRMPKSVLDAAGIGNTPVQFLELWRNGKPVPFSASVTTGALPVNGYLEFWGEINDGKTDKALYRNAAYQHSDKISLISDTASYFLSVNTDQSGFLVTDQNNDVASNSLPVEPYFMYSIGNYYRARMNAGFAAVIGEYVYSSAYDKGEYWSSAQITPAVPLTTSLGSLAVYPSGPSSQINFGASGNSLNTRSVDVYLNSILVKSNVMDYFNDVNSSATFPTSLISSGTASVSFSNTSATATDRLVVSYFEIIYPRQFDFGNERNFGFELPAKAAGYYLEISNFNSGGVSPVLYDLTNGRKFIGDISTPGKVKFALPGSSAASKYLLASQEAANILTVSALTPKTFTNFLNQPNQGDYLIISNPALYTGTHGNNPVNDYKAYRESVQGGSFNAKVIDINELVDQFAFGIKKHPLSVKNFVRFARANFSTPPKNIFIIGHGMSYNEYRLHENDPVSEYLNAVPTFGNPASDNMLSSLDATTPIPLTPIGRLSVVSGKEIEDYLEKVVEYEVVQKTSPNTANGREWMKNVVHVTGASDVFLGTVLCNYMGVYKSMIEDTAFGASVSTFCKTSTSSVEQLESQRLSSLIEGGISMLTYFGHSSSTTLEFNLDNPQSYNNKGKYPVFYVNGCNAGNFFTYFPQRMFVNETLSEKFVLAKQRGTIAFVASTHFGIVNYLNLFLTNLYNTIGHKDYGKSLGQMNNDAFALVASATGPFDYYSRMHLEQMTLHGDPSLKLNGQTKPDYVVEAPLVNLNPAFISIAENSFRVKIKMLNIGKAVPDSITVQVKRQYPDGSTEVIYRAKINAITYADSLSLEIPVLASRDKGNNKLIISIDDDFAVDEIAEDNNVVAKEFFIYEDEARTVFPYQFSIVNNPSQKLYSSTANPFSIIRNYRAELDTTELFNSPLKISKIITSPGGVIEFDPGVTYVDSTVYYWRIAPDAGTTAPSVWNNSSFVYISGNINGFNQSHFYQHKKSREERLTLDSATREYRYGKRLNELFIKQGMYNTSGSTDADFSISVNGTAMMKSACLGRSLLFNVFDPATFKPWLNVAPDGTSLRLSGSAANCNVGRQYNFEFSYTTAASRNLITKFMDSIPDGYYVVVRSFDYAASSVSSVWQADTALYGSNNSLYHKLLAAGFVGIDSVDRPKCWWMAYKKKDFGFLPIYKVSSGIYDRINGQVVCPTDDTLGYITSPVFGPSKGWKELVWRGTTNETPSDDDPIISIIGLDSTGVIETELAKVNKTMLNYDISSISAAQYPYLKLKMRNVDSTKLTPYQLKYWRVYYTPVPEGGLARNIFFTGKDSLEIGERLDFGIAFKNISNLPFDSLAVKVTILDKDNVTHIIPYPRQKPLVSGDTVKIQFSLDSRDYPGLNTIFVELNPGNDQAEQYHFNNFLYRTFYVKTDQINPFLDVTFDGTHILNRDLVSAKPHIQIKLKDEAKYLLLNDTALTSVQIRYPDGVLRSFKYDNDTLRFTPAVNGAENTAVIDFNPQFLKQINVDGDEYELIVKGKDRSGNKAGTTEFRVSFRVISKPMISNLLNYPNPFSTSTAFVFTLTGSEIPQNMKIQILTVTGKIVREITKDELGPIHIGRNITEFKWNGTDQYGQKLGNGVYLYRVVTTMNGRQMDKYKAEGDNTDRYFNNGYGKMYLMR